MKKILKITLAALVPVVLVAVFLTIVFVDGFKTNPNHDYLAKEVIINPEVKTLAKYQKLRNSRIPEEIAEIQAELIVEAASKAKLPVELLVGIISAETAHTFDATAVSGAGAVGLMQILRGQNEEGNEITIDEEKQFNIAYNLSVGCAILKGKLKKTDGNLYKALQMYSGGAGDYPERVYYGVGRYVMYKSTEDDTAIKVVRR